MRNILVRSIAGGSPSHRPGTRRAAMLGGAAALAAVLSLTPLSFASHGNVIGLAAAFAQSGSSTQIATQSTDDMSIGAEAGDDNGANAGKAGDDNGGTGTGAGDASHGGSTSGPGGNSNGSGANSGRGTGGEDGHDSGGSGSGGHGSSGGGD